MPYLQHLLVMMSLMAVIVLSMNLVLGYTGLLSVVQAGFQGVCAYAVTLLLVERGWSFFPALLVGMLFVGMLALVTGFILSRLRGDYFALGSLGLNAILTGVMLNAASLTNGPLGISRIPFPQLLGVSFQSLSSFLVLTLVVLGIVLLGSYWITRSAFGLVLRAIREDESAIQVFGYRTRSFKLVIFVIGSMLAGVTGALYATYIRYIDPTPFTIHASVDVLAAAILGGLGRLRGSLIGAVVFLGLSEAVRFLGFAPALAAQYRLAIVGLLLIVLMIIRPQGILGSYKLK